MLKTVLLAAALLVAALTASSAYAGHMHCHTDRYATTCYED